MMKTIDKWEDLPIGVFLEVNKILRKYYGQDTEEVADAPRLDILDCQVEIVAALSGMTPAQVEDLPLAEYSKASQATAFLSTKMPHTSVDAPTVQVGGYTLTIFDDVSQMKAGQYIDFQQLSARGEEGLVGLLATLMIPEGCTYNNGYSLEDVQRAISEHLPAPTAYGLADFFLQKFEGLMTNIATSLTEEATPGQTKAVAEALEALRVAGAGLRA